MCTKFLQDVIFDVGGLEIMLGNLFTFPFLYLITKWNGCKNPIQS